MKSFCSQIESKIGQDSATHRNLLFIVLILMLINANNMRMCLKL